MSESFLSNILYGTFLKGFIRMPISLHNPFVQDVEPAPLSTFDTFHVVMKSVLGIGTLYMPIAFGSVGLLLGIVFTIALTSMYIYGIHLMVQCMNEVRDRVGHDVTMAETVGYAMKSKVAVHAVNVQLVLLHFSIAVAYIVFISENLKSVANCTWETLVDIRIFIAIVTICIIPLFLIRDVQYLVPINIAGNILMFLLIGTILGYGEVKPSFQVLSLMQGNIELFFGFTVFSFSSVGVMVTIVSKMAQPEAYLGRWGTLNRAACFVFCTNVIWGLLIYMSIGTSQFLPFLENFTFRIGIQFKLLAAALVYLTYPLNGYVAIDIIFNQYINKSGALNHPVRTEFIVRIVFLLLSAICALALPLVMPIVKHICGICLATLNLMYPGITKFCLGHEKANYRAVWMFLDADLIFFCVFAFAGAIYALYIDIDVYYLGGSSFWEKPNEEIN